MSATPRYIPRHSVQAFYAPAELPVKTRGAALRRNPITIRQMATAAIAAGALLFSVAESADSALGEPAGQPAWQPAAASAVSPPAGDGGFDVTAEVTWPRAAMPVSTVYGAAPVHVKKKAPATKAAITGLAKNGIPNIALNAYRVAAARVRHADPTCGVDWPLLAAIGRVESDHGRFAGARLNRNGTSTPRILGPALDGTNSDYIPAPPNGKLLYGDGVYAHALGAMQFIPSTWAIYGSDANGDGVKDVFNINDAALAAARYLCDAGGNLRTVDGQTQAVLAYNHNDAYLAQVLALARAYRTGVPVSGIPVGNTDGALPPLGTPVYIPPVNPGYPTAVYNSPSYGAGPMPTTTGSYRGSAGSTGSTHTSSTGVTRTGSGSSATGGTTTTSRPRTSTTGGSSTRPRTGTSQSAAPAPAPSAPAPTQSSTAPPPPPDPIPTTVPTTAPTTSTPTPVPTTSSPSPSPTRICTPLMRLLHRC